MWQQTVTQREAEVARLRAATAALRAQMLLDSDQGYELARLSALTGIVLHSTTPHEMTEEFAAAVAALRAQLAAREHAACPRCGQSLHGEKLLPF